MARPGFFIEVLLMEARRGGAWPILVTG
jgi:hypothetical protein